jgi:hypothetical protein
MTDNESQRLLAQIRIRSSPAAAKLLPGIVLAFTFISLADG